MKSVMIDENRLKELEHVELKMKCLEENSVEDWHLYDKSIDKSIGKYNSIVQMENLIVNFVETINNDYAFDTELTIPKLKKFLTEYDEVKSSV